MYNENYKILANAIIRQAIDDYYKDVRARPDIEHWIMSEDFLFCRVVRWNRN